MSRLVRIGQAFALVLLSLFALTGCITANFYVSKDQPLRTRADLAQVSHPKPVQLLFEFRQKGSFAAPGTNKVRPIITAVANESGLFSAVTQTPGGGVLTVIIDNGPVNPDDEHKGIATGLTMGLAGTLVTDGYTCTATYTIDGRTTKAELHHEVYTAIGNHEGPPGLVAMPAEAAVNLAMSQIMWNLLKQLSDQHAFD